MRREFKVDLEMSLLIEEILFFYKYRLHGKYVNFNESKFKIIIICCFLGRSTVYESKYCAQFFNENLYLLIPTSHNTYYIILLYLWYAIMKWISFNTSNKGMSETSARILLFSYF